MNGSRSQLRGRPLAIWITMGWTVIQILIGNDYMAALFLGITVILLIQEELNERDNGKN